MVVNVINIVTLNLRVTKILNVLISKVKFLGRVAGFDKNAISPILLSYYCAYHLGHRARFLKKHFSGEYFDTEQLL